MTLKELSQLVQDLEKCLGELKKETKPLMRKQIFNHFKQIYSQVRSELSVKSMV